MDRMALPGSRYPVVLQAVMNHATRLRSFLEQREARIDPYDHGAPWLIGRAGEVQCVVALVALDWHQQRLSGEDAAAQLARYVREIHDGLAMHLDIGSPSCCRTVVSARGRPATAPKVAGSRRPNQPAVPGR
jgi:hypothetical protein